MTRSSSPNPLKVWEVATRRLIRRLNGHTGFCVSLDFSRDGTLLASGSRDGTAILWSTATWKAVADAPESRSGLSSANRDDGAWSRMWPFRRTARPWPWPVVRGTCSCGTSPRGKLLETLKGHSGAVTAVVFSPDGRTLASGSSDQTVRLWNVETRRELMQLDPGSIELGEVRTLAFSPDGKQLLAGGRGGTAFWSAAPIVWNDPDRAAEKLRLLLQFERRLPEPHPDVVREPPAARSTGSSKSGSRALALHTKMCAVQAALAATQANWHASRTGVAGGGRGVLIGWWPPIPPAPRPGSARPGCFAWRRPCCIRIGLPTRPCCCREAPSAVAQDGLPAAESNEVDDLDLGELRPQAS